MPTVVPSMRPKPVTMFLAKSGADLEEVALVDDLLDQLLHVVGLVGVGRDQGVEAGLVALGLVEAVADRRLFAVGERQEVDQAADLGQGLQVVLEGAVGDAGLAGVDARAAQVLVGDDLVGDRLHHVGAGHVHVARVLHHEDEVGHRRANRRRRRRTGP